MNSHSTGVSAAAVEALARNRYERNRSRVMDVRFDDLSFGNRRDLLEWAAEDLQAAYPAILADFRERLLGDEAVEAIWQYIANREFDHMGMPERADLRTALTAAFKVMTEGEEGDDGE